MARRIERLFEVEKLNCSTSLGLDCLFSIYRRLKPTSIHFCPLGKKQNIQNGDLTPGKKNPDRDLTRIAVGCNATYG